MIARSRASTSGGAVFLTLLLHLVAPASADDDIFILPQITCSKLIWESTLLANDSGASTILSFTQPSRGSLNYTSGEFTYKPSKDFWEAGADTFSYEHDASNTPSTVFLFADVTQFASPVDLDVEMSPGKVRILKGTITTGYGYDRIRVTPDGLDFPGDRGDVGGGTIGGDLELSALAEGMEMELANYSSAAAPHTILKVKNDNGYAAKALTHLYDENGHPSYVLETEYVPLTSTEVPVAVQWWTAGSESSGSGGVALLVDGQVVAARTGSAQEEPPWAFRMASYPHASSLPVKWNRVRVWRGDSANPCVNALLAPASGTPFGARTLEIPVLSPNHAVFRPPPGERRHKLRFGVRSRGLRLGPGRHLTLLRGVDDAGVPLFSLALRQEAGELLVCAHARPNDGTDVLVGCRPLDEELDPVLELRWWPASGEDRRDGGLMFWLEAPPGGTRLLAGKSLGLDNWAQSVGEVWLGAIDPDLGTPGTLYFDRLQSGW